MHSARRRAKRVSLRRIIELDRGDAEYLNCLQQPWLHGNRVPGHLNRERILDRIEDFVSSQIPTVDSHRFYSIWKLRYELIRMSKRIEYNLRSVIGT